MQKFEITVAKWLIEDEVESVESMVEAFFYFLMRFYILW